MRRTDLIAAEHQFNCCLLFFRVLYNKVRLLFYQHFIYLIDKFFQFVNLLQGDKRTYSYVVGVSCDRKEPIWEDLMFLARLIPRVCHNVNRVCYIHGDLVRDQILDITPTYPTSLVLATARQVDHAATQVSLLYRQGIHVLWGFDGIKMIILYNKMLYHMHV